MARYLFQMAAGYLALASLWASIRADQVMAAERPNILFIMSDDHAAHAISAYGSKVNETPHIDRLAREGMLFKNCFVTNSLCGPCRAVILTGKYSHMNGFRDNNDRFNGDQQTVAKLLQKAGYATGIIGKWHLGSEPQGFDYWNVLPGQGEYYNPVLIEMGQRKRHEGYVTEIITDLTIDYLKNRRAKDKPFFVMCHHKAPHRNWLAGPRQKDMYKDKTFPEPETFNDDYSTRSSAARTQEMTLEKHFKVPYDTKIEPPAELSGPARKSWMYQRYMQDYLACVAGVDESVGQLLDYLDEAKLADNTLVIYTSDQGFYLGDHGWYDKRFMYEPSLRAPFVVRWPGKIKPQSENEQMAVNVDFAPTFLDLAGAEVPADMQGDSLVPLLSGANPPNWRNSMYYHYYEFPGVHAVQRHLGVRTDRYKLIHFYQIDQWELFDLKADPNELNNVYGKPEFAQLTIDLKAELARLQKQYGDSTPASGNGE